MNKINLNAPMGTTGYGVAAFELARSLYKMGVQPSLFLIGNKNTVQRPPGDVSLISEWLRLAHEAYDPTAPCLKIWHEFDLASRIGKGPYFAFPFFELDELKELAKSHVKTADTIVVASEWAKTVMNKYHDDVRVVPLGVNNDIFYPEEVEKKNDAYVFYNIGKWEVRKGHDILIDAFNNAFETSDNVELWLSTDNMFMSPEENNEWRKFYFNTKLGDKIRFISWTPTQQDLAKRMNMADCGVFPSRAEGWNLDMLEMMACGKPVITTNYSAHTEFCNEENSSLIEIEELEPAYDGKWFNGEGNWAKIGKNQMDSLVEHMRAEYNRGSRVNSAGLATAEQFSWDRSAEKLCQTMFSLTAVKN